MGLTLMIILCLAWGGLMGVINNNPFVAILLGAGGGYTISQVFIAYGLLGA